MTREKIIDLVRPHCRHNKFIVDETRNFVECGLCGEHLNPIWVISQFAYKETRARQHIEALELAAEKTRQKLRCKCQHCGEMTKIYR